MNGPNCLSKLDIRIYEDKVIFSRCCLTEAINFKEVPIQDVISLSECELEDKIFNEFAKLDNIVEKHYDFNCSGFCSTLWASEPDAVYVSHQFCNYYCTMCREHVYSSNSQSNIKECYFKILNALSKSKRNITIGTTTAGEPFIWKKETIDFIASTDKQVLVTSNLSLLDEDFFNRIDNGQFKNLFICGSVDSFNHQVYSQIRRPATPQLAQTVFDNVEKLIHLSKEGKLEFIVNIVLSDLNFSYSDILNTLDFFEKNNFSNFRMSNDIHKDTQYYCKSWFSEDLKKRCHFFFAS